VAVLFFNKIQAAAMDQLAQAAHLPGRFVHALVRDLVAPPMRREIVEEHARGRAKLREVLTQELPIEVPEEGAQVTCPKWEVWEVWEVYLGWS
jgi:hypothetical protein